jgi:DNA-binding CsgD family transcriptional regulator
MQIRWAAMSGDAQVLKVIEALYDAATDEALWPRALKELSEVTSSQAATFWVLDGSDQPRLPTFSYINLDPAFVQDYLKNVAHLDPTVQYLVKHPQQPIVHDGLVINEREKDRHPYYDWHGRYSDLRFRLVGQVCPAPAVHAGVALHRTRNAGRYEPYDIEVFSTLYRHLERALAIGFRLGSLGTLQRCTAELLDRNAASVILLDTRKRVVYANRAAEGLCLAGDGIRLSANGVVAQSKRDNDRMQELVDDVLTHQALRGYGGSMRLARPSGRRPFAVLVSPLSTKYAVLTTARPAVCIVITDPESKHPLPSHRFKAAFGLTEAEARMAALLAAGENLRDTAARLNITYGTARARLAEIFQKTETRRQGELIKVLLATVAALA